MITKRKNTKNASEESEQVIKDFQENYFEKLENYIEIYQELEQSNFDEGIGFDEESQGNDMEENSIFSRRKGPEDGKKEGMKKGINNILAEFDKIT